MTSRAGSSRALFEHQERPTRIWATAAAVLASASAVGLLGVSGWFIAASAQTGALGKAAALGFNFLLPSVAIRLLAVSRTGARYLERLLGHAAALRTMAQVRAALFAALAGTRPETALALSSGEASAMLRDDAQLMEDGLARRAAPWSAAGGALAGLGLAALAGWTVAIALAGGWIFALWLQTRGLRSGARGREDPGAALLDAGHALRATAAAFIAAGPELACYNLRETAILAVEARTRRVAEAEQRLAEREGWSSLLHAVAVGGASAAVLALSFGSGPARTAMAALASLGALETVLVLADRARRGPALDRAQARLDSLLGSERRPERPATDGSLAFAWRGRRVVLSPGQRFAITGPSGCGKTRLIETVIGLRGDGGDLRRFAYAPQDARILTGTVRENLELAAPEADESALWAALRTADLDARIRALPDGLDTWLGDGGARLSGGERRRLSLARALLKPAPWLALDEPTEGLDAVTEARVVQGLADHLLRTGQGLLLVTHRPAPLRLCNPGSPDARREAA